MISELDQIIIELQAAREAESYSTATANIQALFYLTERLAVHLKEHQHEYGPYDEWTEGGYAKTEPPIRKDLP